MKIEKDDITGKYHSTHRFLDVHHEMLLQVCRDYNGLPDYRALKCSEIRFFYDGLRAELIEATKPKG